MSDQNSHVKGVVAGVAAVFWAAVMVGSPSANTMPPPDEPAGESSPVADADNQGESGGQNGVSADMSSMELAVEPPPASSNDAAGAAGSTGRTPPDGIRPRVQSIGEVVGQPAGRVLLSVNDVVTLKLDRVEQAQPHQRYALARRAQFVEHPDSGRNMGYLVHVVGTVELEQPFGRYWSARIVSSSDYVSIDDVVLPMHEANTDVSTDASGDTAGRVVAVQDDLVLTATSQVVFTDLGSNRGVKPGDEFTIVREGGKDRRGFPDRAIGVLRVMSTLPTSSSAFITRSSEPIVIGDRLDPLVSGVFPQ
ncbi:MAG: hypothetical protein ACOYXR_08330 [Nitrospirota bacterium]